MGWTDDFEKGDMLYCDGESHGNRHYNGKRVEVLESGRFTDGGWVDVRCTCCNQRGCVRPASLR